MTQALLWAGSGTGFTFLMTALGAAMVFLFRNQISPNLHRIMLGFAAGVMIAASMWSLLIPAIEEAQELGLPGWLPAAGGSALGILFLVAMDGLLPHLSPELLQSGDRHSAQNALLILAITLHNIPEGMAVGRTPSLLAAQGQSELLPAAGALDLGIGIQNFPEGAAIPPAPAAGRPEPYQVFSSVRPPVRWSPLPPCSPYWQRERCRWPCPGFSPLQRAPCSMWWWRS